MYNFEINKNNNQTEFNLHSQKMYRVVTEREKWFKKNLTSKFSFTQDCHDLIEIYKIYTRKPKNP